MQWRIENIRRDDDYRREKRMKWKKKNPAPRRGVSLFFLEFVVGSVLCRRQRLSLQLSDLHVNMKKRPTLTL